MGEMKEGLVIKGIGGFYYVQCGDVLHACRARGKFRKDKISPYAGDRVRIEVDANDEGYVQEILPRKNFLVRPPLANLDKLFVVSSVCDPQPSTLIIDKTIAAAELKGIEPVLVFTKTDLSDTTELKDIYGSIVIIGPKPTPDTPVIMDMENLMTAGGALTNFLNVLWAEGVAAKTLTSREIKDPQGLFDPKTERLLGFILCGLPQEPMQPRDPEPSILSEW